MHHAAGSPPVWIFDLDNTLHNASAHLFPHINRAMTAYLVEHLQIPEAEADALRQHYWRRYGATMLGLMRHHQTCPRHFLWHTHQFPKLHEQVVWNPALRHVLRHLPGRKVIYSNAPKHYAEAVLARMGIRALFDQVIAVEHVRFYPKPAVRGFQHMLGLLGVSPSRCVMVDDDPFNLLTAKRIGVKTVWIAPQASHRPQWVDLRLQQVEQLARSVHRLAR